MSAAADRSSTGEILTLAVGAPAHGGHCVARPADDPTGRVIFVRHALPGETVRARLTERTAKIWRADAVEVLVASPDRVRPAWAQAGPGGVGGGELSHVSLPAQRTWKRWVLADCLRRLGGEETARAVSGIPLIAQAGGTVPVRPMPSESAAEASDDARVRALAGTGTRTRVSLTVTPEGAAGMHAFRSDEVLPVHSLPLAVAEIQELGLTDRAVWRRHYEPGQRVQAVAPSGGSPVVMVGDRLLTAAAHATGRKRVTEIVDGAALGLGELRYTVHADGFWQVHRDAPRVLVEAVTTAVLAGSLTAPSRPAGADGDGADERRPLLSAGAEPRVLELYSGAGLFTQPLAALGCRVRSLEGSATAVGDARRTLHAHETVELAVGGATPRRVCELGAFDGCGTDVVLLDPPRQGAGRAVIGAVAALGAARIVLVACDPAALARDLSLLLAGGYRPTAMTALDMFPHTHHLETVAVLER